MIKLKVLGPHQTEVQMAEKFLFFSYDTLVAVLVAGIYYRTEKKYSKTTTQHLNRWCPENAYVISQETLEQIAGE